MYSNRFAACIIVNGQIVDELADGSVAVPHGSEYTIRLFNKHDRRAAAKIFLDTENVSQGGFVVEPHGSVDINRRADRDTSFKFVPLGSAEAKAEGKPNTNPNKEMGLVEIHFYLERERPKYIPPVIISPPPCPGPHYPPVWPRPWRSWDDQIIGSSCGLGGTQCSTNSVPEADGDTVMNFMDETYGSAAPAAPDVRRARSRGISGQSMRKSAAPAGTEMLRSMKAKELSDGCTVEGRATGTNFSNIYMDLETTSTVIKLFLQGFKQPVVVAERRRHHKPQTRRARR